MWYKVKRIMVWEKQVRPYKFNPTSNTIAYFPFENDTLDHSGNWVSLSISWSFTKWTLWYVFSSSTSWQGVTFTNWNVAYMWLWFKINSTSNNTTVLNYAKRWYMAYQPTHNDSNLNNKIVNFTSSSYAIWGSIAWFTYQQWHHLAFLYDGTKLKVAKDWVLQDFYNGTWYNFGNGITICSCGFSWNINTNVSDVIVENRAWTADEILNYYKHTKSQYWL